ncbi:MAG: FlgD immunoglobulin-like domain containing protein [Ardenticatenia bacterium]|nr:FlgD immunoglobulin-like domain containing protein [Ardenticatenia bacterium]
MEEPRYATRSRLYRRQTPLAASWLPSLLSVAAGLAVIALLVVLFPLEWVRAPRITLAVDQPLFSPNGDGYLEALTAFYVLSEQANVTAEVINSAGQRVRTLMQEQPQTAGQHALTWDGRDDGGNIVPDGTYRLRVVALGTARRSEHALPVEVDTTPPSLTVANLKPQMTVRESTLTIEGTTDPDALVWLNDGPQPIPVQNNGVFRVVRQLQEGENTITVRAVDNAGNETRADYTIVLRTRPPDITLLEPEAEAWLKENPITVRGQAPADAEVSVNGIPAQVNEDGSFVVDVVLDEGDNVIVVEAKDGRGGNTARVERVVHLRTRPPQILLSNLPDGLTVNDPAFRIAGQVEPGIALTVNGRQVPVDNRGFFSTLLTLQEGQNLITITATDLAGNTSTVQRLVTYEPAPALADLPITIPADVAGRRLLLGTALALLPLFFLLVAWMRPLRFSLSVENPVFYPFRPDDSRLLIMRLDLSRGARVTLRVYDQQDRLVATIVEKRKHSSGEHFRLWDGRDEAGHVLPSGSYLIEATASTRLISATSAARVYLDATPPMIGTVTREERSSTSTGTTAYVEGEAVDLS